MITQAALYKALLRYFDENKVDSEAIESAANSIKESADLLLQHIVKSESISTKLLNSKDVYKKAAVLISKMAENIDPVISTAIYERVNVLKDNIDVFETQILKKLGISQDNQIYSHRLRNKDRIKVFLISRFSAGKTTFVGRLLSDVSGHDAAPPTTACLVIHKQSSVPSLLVAFNKEFSIEKFDSFLNKYDLMTFFTIKNNTYVPNEIQKVFDKWSDDKILEFLNDANDFPEAFTNIVWNHKKTRKGYSFMDFADLYDMPGIEGTGKHDEVIWKILNEHKPDVVLYLIDTSLGCPSDEECKVLPVILHSIMQSEPLPLFYWVFQKPTNYKQLDIESLDEDSAIYDEEFLKGEKEGKKKNLEIFVDEIRNKPNNRFNEKQIKYLAETSVLDARGLRDDTEMAQNAVSLVLQSYFCKNIKIYCEKAGELLKSEGNTLQLAVMNYKPNPFEYKSENPFLKEIFDKIKLSPDTSVENARKIFLERLFLDREIRLSHDFPFDLLNTLVAMHTDIINIIDDILKSVNKDFGKNINLNKLKDIWTFYGNNTGWQGLLFKVQAYHWLIAHYDGVVAPQYINSTGFALLNNIKKDNKRLEDTKIPFLLTAKLFDKTSE